MTRINLVDPSLLSPKHLLSEYKELPRIFGLVKAAIKRGKKPSDYQFSGYRLGTNHCAQFYTRLGWLVRRQESLVMECLSRGYKIQHTQPQKLLDGIPDEWVGDWTPTAEDVKINVARINERGGEIQI